MERPSDSINAGGSDNTFENLYVYGKFNYDFDNDDVAVKSINVTSPSAFTGDVTFSGDIKVTGVTTSTTFSGSGASLTNLPSAQLTGALPALDGSALTGIVAIPSGGIILWSGAADAIPSGFVLCNGSNSTPDLRGRFVVGYHDSNGDYDVDDTGGAESVTLSTSQLPSHSHSFTVNNEYADLFHPKQGMIARGENKSGTESFSTNSTGSGSAHENRPPYYALCYIMKT